MAYNIIFDKDIEYTARKYRFFRIVNDGKERCLKGILDINNKEGECLGSFSIEIKGSIRYPYEFPIVYEVGGDILAEANYHKYKDNSLCIDVKASEILKCYSGMSICDFIEEELRICLNFIQK